MNWEISELCKLLSALVIYNPFVWLLGTSNGILGWLQSNSNSCPYPDQWFVCLGTGHWSQLSVYGWSTKCVMFIISWCVRKSAFPADLRENMATKGATMYFFPCFLYPFFLVSLCNVLKLCVLQILGTDDNPNAKIWLNIYLLHVICVWHEQNKLSPVSWVRSFYKKSH